VVGIETLTETESFIQITSLFWKVNHDVKLIEFRFELPIRYLNPEVEMIGDITEIILPTLMSNGFIVQEGGMNISNEEIPILCSYQDETEIEKSLFQVKDELENHDWYLDIIPSLYLDDNLYSNHPHRKQHPQ